LRRSTFNAIDYQGSGPENYEKFFVPAIGAPLARDLITAASLRPGERILDIACGTGVVTRLAAEQVGDQGSVAGLDVNPCMLAVARKSAPTGSAIDWYETTAEAMPLPDESFDVALCQMGLQFVPNKLKALEETRRVLGRGGRVVLNLPGPTPQMFVALAGALARHVDPQCEGFVYAVFSMYDSDELRTLMSEAGFEDVHIERTQKTLRLPPPEEFLWQYIYSTPLAGPVGQATDEQRAALADEVCGGWQELVSDGRLTLELGVTTVQGK